MADQIPSQQVQETVSPSTSTVTVVSPEVQEQVPTVHLKLRKPKSDRKVQWSTETVDNEHMNKKKSKCCCIYKKPRQFGESSSSDDSDDDCDHCKGHVETKKQRGEGDLEATENGTVTLIEEDSQPPQQSL